MVVVRRIVHPFIEEKGSDRAAQWWQEADIALAAGRISRARRFLRWILAARPDDEAAWLRLAELASSPPAQVAYLQQAYAFHPHSRRVQEALRRARARQLEAHGGDLEHRLLPLCRLPGKAASLPASHRTEAQASPSRGGRRTTVALPKNRRTVRGLRIAVTAACALLAMALLPHLALPFGDPGRQNSAPADDRSQVVPPPAQVSAQAGPENPYPQVMPTATSLAARVNGQGIAMETVWREMARLPATTAFSSGDPKGEAAQARIPALRRQALDRLIDEVLIQQAAKEFGIAIAHTGPADNDTAGFFEGSQAKDGQAEGQYQQELSRDRLRQAVFDRVTAGAGDTMEMVRARQIVLASKQDAWEVIVRLADGKDFSQLAEATSLDRQTRDRGGDLGWLPRGLGWIAPEVEEAAFAAVPSQIRGPVHVDGRYVIVQTLDHEEHRALDPGTRSALQARDFERWLADRRNAADIEILADLDSPTP